MQVEKKARQITVAEMSPHVHSFASNENKVNKISTWLIDWIKRSLYNGQIKPYDKLPAKGDLAFHIGVSKGTIQNVFRYVEDIGYVESKQRIGTYISPSHTKHTTKKLTSKRELAIETIKQFIISENLQKGDSLISTRKLSQLTGISNTTIRMAISSLISEDILKKGNNSFIVNNTNFSIENLELQTLVEKIADNLKEYVKKHFKSGERLPGNFELAQKFKVSAKTIHDAIKLLSKEGILQTRRGQYGTILANTQNDNNLYYYEKIELKIRHFIAEQYEVGSKLPSIVEFSKKYQVSAKTIKKALDNLAEEGYVTFVRGRYGGTFVTDIPEKINEAYKWLAISPSYISSNAN